MAKRSIPHDPIPELTRYINELLDSTKNLHGGINDLETWQLLVGSEPTRENVIRLLLDHAYGEGYRFGQKDLKHEFRNLMGIVH